MESAFKEQVSESINSDVIVSHRFQVLGIDRETSLARVKLEEFELVLHDEVVELPALFIRLEFWKLEHQLLFADVEHLLINDGNGS